jgi:glycosyltransferase involved in cell wall biosynthesis
MGFAMPSVVIPACNEEAVLERCLSSVFADQDAGDLEVVVVCNGCIDRTAEIARGFDQSIIVVETDVASKSNALNLGDQAVAGFPRMYLDADIELGPGALRGCLDALDEHTLAVSPTIRFDMNGASPVVRMYYAVWRRMTYFNQSHLGTGVFVLGESGRARFEVFPPIIADDGFVRLQFAANERVALPDCHFTARAYRTLGELVAVKSRILSGTLELHAQHPELVAREEKTRGGSLWRVLRRPGVWASVPAYLLVKWLVRRRVRQKRRDGTLHQWDRGDSVRTTGES